MPKKSTLRPQIGWTCLVEGAIQFHERLGFAHLHSDAGIFVCQGSTRLIVAVVYVDDTMFFGKNEKLVKKKKAPFMAKWDC